MLLKLFIKIFELIKVILQWLVKRAIEVREETGDYVRAYSISQFNKTHKTPEVGLLSYS